ncbi:hypothetical protein JD276_03065 [Leucobacter sp. CSA1]|uniref:Uncharacterized protein n=1 Tax=Leucobacter chromiisoli TaxID=2796471 RepID=A0A934Q602_9MICO|nr:hypothetical protein [Leucobacter chromiisoli]MBK0418015.1 hypothetical protein [Leucobacter chromiisoli]
MTPPEQTADRGVPARPGPAARTKDLAARAVRMELLVYESLWRAVSRRPKIDAGAHGFRYHGPVLTVLIIFIVLSAVEIPIIDLIVHRWTPVRIGFLILGIWGLTWMIGLLCAYFTRPHTVGPEGIRVREGLEIDVLAEWGDVASVRVRTVSAESIDPTSTEKPGRVFDHEGERICAIWVGSETNLEIEFEGPTEVVLPGLAPKGGSQVVDRLRFWGDDPEALLRAVRDELEAARDPR